MKQVIFLCIVLLFNITNHAQERGKFSSDINLGYQFTNSKRFALELTYEFKYNIIKSLSVGTRFGFGFNSKNAISIEDNNTRVESISERTINLLGTLEYRFPIKNSSFEPFVGFGYGYFRFREVGLFIDGDTHREFGKLFRLGMEIKNFRFTFNLYKIPKSTYEVYDDEIVGYLENNYISFSIGYVIKNMSWKTKKKSLND